MLRQANLLEESEATSFRGLIRRSTRGKSKASWADIPSEYDQDIGIARFDPSFLSYPDKTRGVLNEGGFYAERAGYHLPALPTSVTNAWATRSPSQGPPTSSPGVGFFRKEFKLDIDSSLDAALSFNFKDIGSNPHWRATLWVNGWTMGRVVGDMGPQFKFPVHEGILDYDGTK